MLAKEIIGQYDGQVSFIEENYGSSELADRYGIKRYPVVFVNDVLVARPSDFGFYGKDGKGNDRSRYTPWREAASHERFKTDLAKMIDLALRDAAKLSEEFGVEADASPEISTLPEFSLSDLSGTPLNSKDLAGRPIIVEFWATWCPPCRKTLDWLATTQQRYGDKVAIVAIAIESEEPAVRELVASKNLPFLIALGSQELAVQFGDIVNVPTMFIFGPQGETVSVFYGAPDDLHETANELIASLIK